MTISLLILTTLAALWTVMARSLLKAAIGLAITSALIAVVIFRMNAELAAVIELSVCAGLITAIFVSTISLTKPLTHKEILEISKYRMKRYWYLPVIVIAMAIGMVLMKVKQDFAAPALAIESDIRTMLWNARRLDMLGQVIILIAGALGVVMLFQEERDSK